MLDHMIAPVSRLHIGDPPPPAGRQDAATCLESERPILLFDPGRQFPALENGEICAFSDLRTDISPGKNRNLGTARQAADKVFNSHSDDIAHGRTERDRQKRSLEGIAAVSDRANRSFDN